MELNLSPIIISGSFLYNKKPWLVQLHSSHIYLKSTRNGEKIVLNWNAVAAVFPKDNTFTLITCVLSKNKKTRVRKDWVFTAENNEEPKKYTDTINTLLYPNHKEGKPRKILFLVNPFSGKKKAYQIFNQIKPILEAASYEITFEVQVTEKAQHAFEIVKSLDLNKIDGIISVSGDGLFYEIVNGIMSRPDWESAIKVPLGVIPAGSGDGLAAALGSFKDPFSSVLMLIKGYHRPLDLFKVANMNKVEWGFLSLQWTILSDVDIGTENLRWMGSARFLVGGVKRMMSLRKYRGRLCYLPSEDAELVKCGVMCPTCKIPQREPEKKPEKEDSSEEGKKKKEKKDKKDKKDKKKKKHQDKEEKSEQKEEPKEVEPPKLGPTSIVTHVDFTKPPENWKVIEGEFIYFCAANVSHVSHDVNAAPKAHLSDGNIDVVLWKTDKGIPKKKELLAMFNQLESGEYVNHPHIEYLKVKALTLEPGFYENTKPGFLAVDGEHWEYLPVSMECHQGLASIYCQSSQKTIAQEELQAINSEAIPQDKK